MQPSTSPTMFMTSEELGRYLSFVDDGDLGVQSFGKGPGPLHASCVGRDDDQIVLKMFFDIVQQYRGGKEIVHRDIEKTLNLAGMEVHGQNPAGPGRGNQIGHQFGGDGYPGATFRSCRA